MPSDVARVQGSGNLLVGKAYTALYTALLDIQSGDELEIKLGKAGASSDASGWGWRRGGVRSMAAGQWIPSQ
jgi:hypothetical protein